MAQTWTPDSWRAKPIRQVPTYPDADKVTQVEKNREIKFYLGRSWF